MLQLSNMFKKAQIWTHAFLSSTVKLLSVKLCWMSFTRSLQTTEVDTGTFGLNSSIFIVAQVSEKNNWTV